MDINSFNAKWVEDKRGSVVFGYDCDIYKGIPDELEFSILVRYKKHFFKQLFGGVGKLDKYELYLNGKFIGESVNLDTMKTRAYAEYYDILCNFGIPTPQLDTNEIIEHYVDKIMDGKCTLDEVPTEYKEFVNAWLNGK